MKYLDLNLKEIHELLVSKKIKPIDLVNEAICRINENSNLNAIITDNFDDAKKRAIELENVDPNSNLLYGIPIIVKDNILTKDLRTTCASHMLDNFIPIYDAFVVELLKSSNMIIMGKANMDEFAFGSSSRTSYFGAPCNPWDISKISGGSSGGSAVCVSSRMVPFSLGSDTGGSIRQPSSYCGIVGMKPTYGRVSRYGLVAFASSLDQIGPMSRNVYENAVLLNAICKKDKRDLTSVDTNEDFTRLIGKNIKGMHIGVVNYFVSDIVSSDILNTLNNVIDILKKHGAIVDYIDIDYVEYACVLYQIIAMGEASSNLARFDGIRYGFSSNDVDNIDDMYLKTRALGFGDEVKRRCMVGSYILSGDNAKIYYNKALSIRDDISKSFKKAFEKYNLLIGPTTVSTAYDLSDPMDDPSKSFLDDVLVIPANLAGLPSLNLPIGFSSGMPIGMNIIGNSFDEATIYKLASFVENELKLDLDPNKGGK